MKRLLFVLLIISVLVIGCAKTEQPAQNNAPAQKTTAPVQQVSSEKAQISAISVKTSSPSFVVNDRLTIYPVVKNSGGAINGVEVGLYADKTLIKMYNFNFKAGETKGPMYEWYPSKAGEYEIKIIVDPNNKLDDDRSDNQATSKVVITE